MEFDLLINTHFKITVLTSSFPLMLELEGFVVESLHVYGL